MNDEPFWIGMEVATLAYAAGLFDGEGTIGISGPTARRPRSHQLRVAVNMTHEGSIQFFADMFGGSCRRQHSPSAVVLGRRPKWVWRITSGRAEAFLRAVRPYLRTKADQADVALEFQSRMRTNWGRGGVPVDEIEARETLRRRISALNQCDGQRFIIEAGRP